MWLTIQQRVFENVLQDQTYFRLPERYGYHILIIKQRLSSCFVNFSVNTISFLFDNVTW